MAHKPKTGDDARPRGQKVGLTVREGQVLRKNYKDLSDRVVLLEQKLAHYQSGMTDEQFIDGLVMQMSADGGRGLPKDYQATAWLSQALEIRRALRETAEAMRAAAV